MAVFGVKNSKMKVTIIDGHTDEPSCLSVPPSLGPLPRYLAGAALSAGWGVEYFTIGQVRESPRIIEHASKTSGIVVLIAGSSVPGKYLGGVPASKQEILEMASSISSKKMLAGPAALFWPQEEMDGLFDVVCDKPGNADVTLKSLIETGKAADQPPVEHAISEFATKGASIVRQHPNFPDYLIAEIETYRGCPYRKCSFCAETAYGGPVSFRPVEEIVAEVGALYNEGVRAFRLGNQPDLFSYMAKAGVPNPEAIEKLFSGIRSVAPGLTVLHIDNVNPATMARHPREAEEIAKTIVKHHTSGDVAALGVESVDPRVVKENNLKASREESLFAVELLNKIGSKIGNSGMPELLPGLNFVFGLKGETRETFRLDLEFLKGLLERKLLVRRINLRQVQPLPGTVLANDVGDKIARKHHTLFKSFKFKVREQIDRPMLRLVLPRGTFLRDIYAEVYEEREKLTYCRQLGSYPILVAVPERLELKKFHGLKIVDYGFRSVTGLPYPLDINKAPRKLLEVIPGVGKKTVVNILAKRPFKSREEIETAFEPEIAKSILEYAEL